MGLQDSPTIGHCASTRLLSRVDIRARNVKSSDKKPILVSPHPGERQRMCPKADTARERASALMRGCVECWLRKSKRDTGHTWMRVPKGGARLEIVWAVPVRACWALTLYHPDPLRQRMVFSYTGIFSRPCMRVSSTSSSSDSSSSWEGDHQ